MDSENGRVFSCMVTAVAAICTVLQLTTEIHIDASLLLQEQDMHSKRRRILKTVMPPILAYLDEEDLFFKIVVENATKAELFGPDYGPWYIKPRSLHWWEQFAELVMREEPERFRKMFRVSVPTFFYLCELLSSSLQTNPPLGLKKIARRVLHVQKQVAISLRRLGTGDSFTSVGELFGVAEPTVHKVCRNFVKALIVKGHHHLQWPEGEVMAQCKLGFENIHGIPQCCGPIDCTHIRFDLPPGGRSTDWFDRDHNYSMILQAIVDSNMRFIDVFAGFPGSAHDARVFQRSEHNLLVQNRARLNGPTREIEGVEVKEFIIGDAGYTRSDTILTPYPGNNLPPLYDSFNFKHSSTRMVVERAFGVLKGMWRILKQPMTHPDVTKVPGVIVACCILHNIVIEKDDVIDESIVLWGHHDEGYRQEIVSVVPNDVGEQLQLAIAKHLYLLDATRFNQ